MASLSDLSPFQIRIMIRLDDGQPHEDSVGKLESEMTIGEFQAANQLVHKGLVERIDGRGEQVWYRLSEAGRKLREEGEE